MDFTGLHNVVGCARCGGDHPDLFFKKFQRPAYLGEITVDGWAMCPTTMEPILLGVVFKEQIIKEEQ